MPILNEDRNHYVSPMTYADCLHLWLTGERDGIDPAVYRPGADGRLEREHIGAIDVAAHGRVTIDREWNRSIDVQVCPAPNAGNGPQGPNGFLVFSTVQGAGFLCEVHHHDDTIGIGEHYKLTSTPISTGADYYFILPGITPVNRRILAGPSGFIVRRVAVQRLTLNSPVATNADLLPVLELRGVRVACPVRGTNLLTDTDNAHEGTIVLPDGSTLTDVFQVTYAPELRDRSATYIADLGFPVGAMVAPAVGAPAYRRCPAKWAGAALGVASVAGATLLGGRR